jgi:16S rRNA (cytosine1402-N4)-methyltransferase
MLREAVEWMRVREGGAYVDATLGGGGHAEALLEGAGPRGRLLGLDADPEAIDRCRRRLDRFGGRFTGQCRRFSELEPAAREAGFDAVDGVLMDLGVSSWQLDEPRRGFSFQSDGPLDMRMDPRGGTTAADLVNGLPERELADLIHRWGEDPAARRIARRIVREREAAPILTTGRLAEVVAAACGGRRGPRHPATRTFQALRMAVNREAEELDRGLGAAARLLRPAGRLVVISFHRLEDGAVKRFVRAHEGRRESLPEGGERLVREDPPLRALTRRPVEPSADEVQDNARARSARLRAAERTA